MYIPIKIYLEKATQMAKDNFELAARVNKNMHRRYGRDGGEYVFLYSPSQAPCRGTCIGEVVKPDGTTEKIEYTTRYDPEYCAPPTNEENDFVEVWRGSLENFTFKGMSGIELQKDLEI